MPDPARRSAPADVSASHRVPCPPDRCPSHRNECGVVTNIIPGQSDTYHHLQARVTDLLAESGLKNPGIKDELARLCARGSTKMPAYLLPSLNDALNQGRSHTLLTLALAAWFRYLRGVDLQGAKIRVEDVHAVRLQALATAGQNDPRPLLGVRSIFGRLRENTQFVTSLERMLCAIEREGLPATMRACLASDVANAA